MKKILDGCTAIFVFAVFCYCVAFIVALCHRVRRKEKIPWDQFNPLNLLRGSHINIVLFFVLAIGLVNAILSQVFASTKIGAFYEMSKYTENYDAILYIDEKPVFCIVAIDKRTDNGRSNYWITEISLPYGHSEFVDAEYDPDQNYVNICLGDWGWDCNLTLGEPATSLSYTMLKNEVVSNYGELCGSRESDTYHLLDCQYAKNIKPQNLIYFENQQEAEVLGYSFCSICVENSIIIPNDYEGDYEDNLDVNYNFLEPQKVGDDYTRNYLELRQHRYVASIHGDKYHLPDCRYAGIISAANRIYYATKEDAAADGKEPCPNCEP